jgi:hypothetical protein
LHDLRGLLRACGSGSRLHALHETARPLLEALEAGEIPTDRAPSWWGTEGGKDAFYIYELMDIPEEGPARVYQITKPTVFRRWLEAERERQLTDGAAPRVTPRRIAKAADLDASIAAITVEIGGKTDREAIRKKGVQWLEKRGIQTTADALEKRFNEEVHAVRRRLRGRPRKIANLIRE